MRRRSSRTLHALRHEHQRVARIPEIDGFKPSHRKLLYTMYKDGPFLNGARQKKRAHRRPDDEAQRRRCRHLRTMVRLAAGNEALLAPFVESRATSASIIRAIKAMRPRATPTKLSPIPRCFKDIDKDPVDFVDSYDSAMKGPRLLPTVPQHPCVCQQGHRCRDGVRHLRVQQTGVHGDHALPSRSDCDLLECMPAPDFSTGGEIVLPPRGDGAHRQYSGHRRLQIRSRWRYLPTSASSGVRNTVHDQDRRHHPGAS